MGITEKRGPELRAAVRAQAAEGALDPIPFTVLGDAGEDLVFLHANGYPPECYQTLLSTLATRNRVWAMCQRPLWEGSQPEAINSWHPLSDDLLCFLDQRGLDNVIVVGHSMGAIVALRAALQAPTKFGALVLLDPVLVSEPSMLAWRLTRQTGAEHPLQTKILRTSRRKRSFISLEDAFRGYRRHSVFGFMSDEALGVVVAGLAATDPHGMHGLRYSPEWEARIYSTAIWNDGDLWDGLPQLTIPTLIVRGSESDTLSDSTCRAVIRANPHIRISVIGSASHLVPLEQPDAVHQAIEEFVRNHAGTVN